MGPAWGPMGPYGPNVATELEAALAADLSGYPPYLSVENPPRHKKLGILRDVPTMGGTTKKILKMGSQLDSKIVPKLLDKG